MNRRELFAAAGAIAVSPILPAQTIAPAALRILPSMTFRVQLAGTVTPMAGALIARMVAEQIERWEREGLLDCKLAELSIRGSVSV